MDPVQSHQRRVPLLLQRLMALWAAGCLLFNYPLLQLWLGSRTVLGLPLLPLALFAVWGLLIGALAWMLESQRTRVGPGDAAAQTDGHPEHEGLQPGSRQRQPERQPQPHRQPRSPGGPQG